MFSTTDHQVGLFDLSVKNYCIQGNFISSLLPLSAGELNTGRFMQETLFCLGEFKTWKNPLQVKEVRKNTQCENNPAYSKR